MSEEKGEKMTSVSLASPASRDSEARVAAPAPGQRPGGLGGVGTGVTTWRSRRRPRLPPFLVCGMRNSPSLTLQCAATSHELGGLPGNIISTPPPIPSRWRPRRK